MPIKQKNAVANQPCRISPLFRCLLMCPGREYAPDCCSQASPSRVNAVLRAHSPPRPPRCALLGHRSLIPWPFAPPATRLGHRSLIPWPFSRKSADSATEIPIPWPFLRRRAQNWLFHAQNQQIKPFRAQIRPNHARNRRWRSPCAQTEAFHARTGRRGKGWTRPTLRSMVLRCACPTPLRPVSFEGVAPLLPLRSTRSWCRGRHRLSVIHSLPRPSPLPAAN